jgi:predicted MFS family arabinose efflux permease
MLTDGRGRRRIPQLAKRPIPGGRRIFAVRRLFPLVLAVFFLETCFFAAVAPLLPHYVEEHDLSKAGAGALAAAYAAGTFLGAIPSGLLAVRLGLKRTLCGSLVLLGSATVAFGLANHIVLLDVTRFLQGVGGAGLWAAGMAWLVAASPPTRRGQMIGFTLGAGTVGLLLGPALGGLASAIGPELAFGAVGIIAIALALLALSIPAIETEDEGDLSHIVAAVKRPAIVLGFWLFMLPAVFAGVVEVLVPLHLSRLGAGGALIATTFIVAAAVEAGVAPAAGLFSDRRGPLAPLQLGLAISVAMALVLPTPDTTLLVAVCLAISFAAFGLCWTPGMALLSGASLRASVPLAIPFTLTNLAWSGGHMIGSSAGAALASATSDAVPYALVGAICFVTLLATRALRPRILASESPSAL